MKLYNVTPKLRKISEELEDFKDMDFKFPELNIQDAQELAIYRAASTIAKHKSIDAGHDIKGSDLAALLYYIADMIDVEGDMTT